MKRLCFWHGECRGKSTVNCACTLHRLHGEYSMVCSVFSSAVKITEASRNDVNTAPNMFEVKDVNSWKEALFTGRSRGHLGQRRKSRQVTVEVRKAIFGVFEVENFTILFFIKKTTEFRCLSIDDRCQAKLYASENVNNLPTFHVISGNVQRFANFRSRWGWAVVCH